MSSSPFQTISFAGFAPAHGIFNRHGGVSPPPFDSLNVSYGVGDEKKNVRTNRELIKKRLGLNHLISARQVHGSEVLVIDKPPGKDMEMTGFDAFISNVPGVGLMVQQADCQAVLIHDPSNKVVANIHCGWRGSVTNIIGKTVETMKNVFGTDPAEISAVLSPSLGPCCAEFVNYQRELPPDFDKFQVKPYYFDFWAISRSQLEEKGVMPAQITVAGSCTVCDSQWFSYRREGQTGRFCSVIGIGKDT